MVIFANGQSLISQACMDINMALKQETFSFIFDRLKMILLVLLLSLGNVVTAFKCDFDLAICGFVQDDNDEFDWTRHRGSTPSIATGPCADHTGNGYYMYIETSSPRQQGDNAKLNSPMLQFSGSMCLKFYYHMYGADIATLNVIINGNNVFTASGNKGNKWLRAAIDISLSGKHAVIFEGIRGSDYKGDIAIDDFLLEPGYCPSTFGCNFDTSTCGFVQDSNDNFDWTRNQGSTGSTGTGPSADHTTGNGYYMYIETSSPRKQGDTAKLNSPTLQFSGSMCLKFYYHMYGVNIATLNVIINGNNVFTASGNKDNKWLRAAVDVSLSGTHAVIFKGIRGSSYQGDIAIDDFLLEPGYCPSTFNCNFDTSMCGFVQDSNDNFDWTRNQGSTWSTGTGPSADYTTGNGYYMYIETSSPRKQGDTAKLNSPMLQFSGSMCLKFYYHMYGANIATLNVIIKGNNVFTASGNKGNKWLRAAIDISLSGKHAVIFEGIRGSSYQSDIAIDDFLLEPGYCPSTFNCNFDTSMCGFVQDSNDNFDWTRNQGSTWSTGTGPSADYTTGNGYYMYIETSSPRKQGDTAKLNSPMLQFSGSMCLKFYYHMYGANIATLNVIIKGNKVFTASGNKGNKWLRAAIDISLSGKHAVIFEGIRGSSYQGDIAIDEFLLEPGSCPSTFNCNFDTSMCGFVQDSNDNFDWTRNQGSTGSTGTGPSADYTTGNGYYMYIETSSPRKQGDTAKLNSPMLQFSGSMCLKFYYHMYGANIATLNVIIKGNKVFTASGNKGNKWLRAAIDISLSGKHAVIFEGIRGSDYQGDIAIDDVLLEPGSCSSNSCGIRSKSRIVGGVSANHGDWPWQVQLRPSSSSNSPYCGGSLVSDQWVVTATHCVKGKQLITVRLGAHRRVKLVGTEQDIQVSKVIIHPSYHNPLSRSNDIALLKLAKPAQLNRYVDLVCLPHHVSEPSDGTKCWITGWGRLSSGGSTPDYLQQVQVPVVSRARCDKAYPGKIHDSMICAGLNQGGVDSCQGDSGGPMVCETGGKFYLQGVTSWGHGCASPGKFGVYAKVKYLLSWINSEMSKN